MNTLIKRARILDPAGKRDFIGDVFLSQGKIEALGEDLFSLSSKADEVIDANGLVVAPGLIDMHVHLRDPGFTQKEDVFSGCRAAAAGGVTSLLAMPNTKPAMDTPETVSYLLKRAKAADAHVYTAACITRNLGGRELADLEALKTAGAIAFSDDGRPVLDTACLLEALRQAQRLGVIVAAHCEDLYLAKEGLMHEGEFSKKLGVKGIPAAAEDCGTAREIAAAASIGAAIHICHVSTKGSVELIRDAKRRGVKVTAETCPHYLLLTHKALEARDANCRMNPPLRREEDRLALIEGLKDGTIDAISTDHAPHTPEEKSNFLTAPNGSIGMETSLAASWSALNGELSLLELLEKMSLAPAKILGIPGGTLALGAEADLFLFDPAQDWVVNGKKLHGNSRNTPFEGMTLKGKVKLTFCSGRKVYEEIGREGSNHVI